MIKAVFFDMDGTLLPLDMREYLPRHRADLAKKVFPALDPGRADKAQLDTLLTLLDQGDGRHRGVINREVFELELSARVGLPFDDFREDFERYFDADVHAFAKDYPSHPRAMDPVRAALDKGLRCVLTTNPVFPRKHTRARIGWGKLDLNCFEFFTVMEDSCTAKPHTAFLRETMARLGGVRPEECALVGNDPYEDMLPASALGMKAFYLNYLPARKARRRCWDAEGDFPALMDFIRSL